MFVLHESGERLPAPRRRKSLTCVVHFVGLRPGRVCALPVYGARESYHGSLALPTFFPPQLFIDLPSRRAFAPGVTRALARSGPATRAFGFEILNTLARGWSGASA